MESPRAKGFQFFVNGADFRLVFGVGRKLDRVDAEVCLVFLAGGQFQRMPDGVGGAGAIGGEDGEVMCVLGRWAKGDRIRHTESMYRAGRRPAHATPGTIEPFPAARSRSWQPAERAWTALA